MIKKDKIQKMKDKYGSVFFEDLKSLELNPFWTLEYVGNKYNITGERIRQIFNFIYYPQKYGVYRRAKSKRLEEDNNMNGTCDPRHRLALSSNKNSSAYKGIFGEVHVLEKISKMGMEVIGTKISSTDFIVRSSKKNYKIEVKSCFKSVKTSKSATLSSYYRFNLLKSEVSNDFLIVYGVPTSEYFIIPMTLFKNKFLSKDIYMAYIPVSKNNRSKYEKYRNAWYLLDK